MQKTRFVRATGGRRAVARTLGLSLALAIFPLVPIAAGATPFERVHSHDSRIGKHAKHEHANHRWDAAAEWPERARGHALGVWKGRRGSASPTAVPEPSSLLVFVTALLLGGQAVRTRGRAPNA
jgi:hypothetical protein